MNEFDPGKSSEVMSASVVKKNGKFSVVRLNLPKEEKSLSNNSSDPLSKFEKTLNKSLIKSVVYKEKGNFMKMSLFQKSTKEQPLQKPIEIAPKPKQAKSCTSNFHLFHLL